jgi:hypothetical protein
LRSRIGALVRLRFLVVLCALGIAGCSADNVDSPLEFFPGSQTTSWADCGKFGGGGNDILVCAGFNTAAGTSTPSSYSIQFFLPSPSDVRIEVFDAHANLVKVLLNDSEPATIGPFRQPPVDWDLTDAAGQRVKPGNYRVYMRASPSFLSSSDVVIP